jgi:hypothetical protein
MLIVALNRTVLKTCYCQTLLVAVGHDVNNYAYPLACAIVEGKSAESWGLFYEHRTITNTEVDNDITKIINNEDKGLTAVGNKVTLALSTWCCWHIV